MMYRRHRRGAAGGHVAPGLTGLRLGLVVVVGLAASCQDGIEPAGPSLEGGVPRDGAVEVTALPESDGGGCEPFLPALLTGSLMATGLACLECHGGTSADGQRFHAAGTVFDDVAREDRCQGVGEVQVVLTEPDGTEHRFLSNLAGNFYFDRELEFPVQARLEADGRVRRMAEDVEHGDCNACHTAEGEQNAPGRIVTPLVP